jgi:hypothetical protein
MRANLTSETPKEKRTMQPCGKNSKLQSAKRQGNRQKLKLENRVQYF